MYQKRIAFLALLLLVLGIGLVSRYGETNKDDQLDQQITKEVVSAVPKALELNAVNTEISFESEYGTDLLVARDYFGEAIQLYELALQGDAKSQYRLAQILMLCSGPAIYAEQISNAMSLLHNRSDIISESQLSLIQGIMTNCADFNSLSLELFLPSQDSEFWGEYRRTAKYDFFSERWGSVPNKTEMLLARLTEDPDILPLLWMTQAANTGHSQALAEAMLLGIDGLIQAELDQPENQRRYLELLEAGSPEAWLGLGACAEFSGAHETGMVLQNLVCQHSNGCQGSDSLNALHMRMFLTMSFSLNAVGASHAEQEQVLESFQYFDYADYINEQLQVIPDYQEKAEQIRLQKQNQQFQVDTLKSCVCSVSGC